MARRFRDPGTTERQSKPSREPKAKIIIVCEGKRTEPNYFDDFARLHRNGLVRVETVGLGVVPLQVVERAIIEQAALLRNIRKQGDSFAMADQVWAVFDRDEHPSFDAAIGLAEVRGIPVAYSNPCFEVWGMMHYRFVDWHIDRKAAQSELHQKHPSYHHDANPCLDVSLLQGEKYENALHHAEQALQRRKQDGDTCGNPSTSVHLLTERIRQCGQAIAPPLPSELELVTRQLEEIYPPEEAQCWLYSPQESLKGEIPADLIRKGRSAAVAAVIGQLNDATKPRP